MKEVLIASLHHCDKEQYLTLFCPFLLFWKAEAHSFLYSGQSRKLSPSFETLKTIEVKDILWFSATAQ